MNRPDLEARWLALGRATAAASEPGQPDRLYRALHDAFAEVIGFKLFTLMVFDPVDQGAQRLFTSDPESYPVGGRKKMAQTPWAKKVIEGKSAWIGSTAEDIRWAYPDHELIANLGLESAINLPVIYDGNFIGSANLLHEANWFSPLDIEIGKPFAALLTPAFLAFGTAAEDKVATA